MRISSKFNSIIQKLFKCKFIFKILVVLAVQNIVICNSFAFSFDTIKIVSDFKNNQIDSNYIYLYQSTSDTIMAKDILSYKFIDSFRNYNLIKYLINKNSDLWIKLYIKNELPYLNQIGLLVPNENIDLYIIDSFLSLKVDPVASYLNNSLSIEQELIIYKLQLKKDQIIEVVIKSNKISSNWFDNTNFGIYNLADAYYLSIKNKEYNISKKFVYNSIFAGIYLWASIIVLLIYITDRSRIYLNFHLILLLTFALTVLSQYEYDIKSTGYQAKIMGVFIIVIYLLFNLWISFIRNLFDTRATVEQLDKWLRWVSLLLIPVYLFILFVMFIIDLFAKFANHKTNLFSIETFTLVTAVYFILFGLFILFVFYQAFNKNKRINYYLFIPTGLYLILFILSIAEFIYTHDDYWSTRLDWVASTTLCFSALMITYELFKRFNQQRNELLIKEVETKSLQIEKERILIEAAKKKNEDLEYMVKERTSELTFTLDNLKSTQNKLIQSEKLAHLGQLTAGVAHEIQNPLNFINNFSEINAELTDELLNELKASNKKDILALAESIKSNSQKVQHHGKRAEAIVKNMLQHSKPNPRMISLVDVNSLLEECWRLSYHGFRDKDKSFNAHINLDLDMSMDKINVNPEELGRAFINLISNALYTIHERWKRNPDDPEYLPAIELITLEINGGCAIKIIDNGTGIPDAIKDEVFNPFFTTKPTGQGVGLGLSLVYDIITKGHNGKIDFESKEGEGTTFVIEIPNNPT